MAHYILIARTMDGNAPECYVVMNKNFEHTYLIDDEFYDLCKKHDVINCRMVTKGDTLVYSGTNGFNIKDLTMQVKYMGIDHHEKIADPKQVNDRIRAAKDNMRKSDKWMPYIDMLEI